MRGKKETVKDHLGQEFKSIAEMCRYWGIKRNTYYSRIRIGLSVREALTSGKKLERISFTDKDGQYYHSLSEYCRLNNKSMTTISSRYRKASSIETIDLESNANESGDDLRCKRVKDHLGKEFRSETDMCRYYGVKVGTYRKRIEAGIDKETALYPGKLGKKKEVYYDHLGNKYYSIKEMCEKYGIGQCTFKSRLESGKDIQHALTDPIDERVLRGRQSKNGVDKYIQ